MLSGDYIATPLSLPLPHAGEVVECDPGVEALGDASRPHPGAGVSLPREYSVLLYLYLSCYTSPTCTSWSGGSSGGTAQEPHPQVLGYPQSG